MTHKDKLDAIISATQAGRLVIGGAKGGINVAAFLDNPKIPEATKDRVLLAAGIPIGDPDGEYTVAERAHAYRLMQAQALIEIDAYAASGAQIEWRAAAD